MFIVIKCNKFRLLEYHLYFKLFKVIKKIKFSGHIDYLRH